MAVKRDEWVLVVQAVEEATRRYYAELPEEAEKDPGSRTDRIARVAELTEQVLDEWAKASKK